MIEYKDIGENYIIVVDGKTQKCVSCGKPLEYNKETKRQNHHCSKKHENMRNGQDRVEFRKQKKPSFGSRLNDGFDMTRIK